MSTAREDLLRGVWKENPILVLALGMCPTLAVTNTVANSLAMGLATAAVLVASCVMVSVLRRAIPNQVRIATFVLIIATFVTAVDYTLAAIVPTIHKALGAFIALIVVNCIILGRQEAFASKNPPFRAFLDAAGMGIGFVLALLVMGTVREVIGSGTFLGTSLFGPTYEPWVVLILPPGGFLTLGVLLMTVNRIKARRARRAASEPAPAEPVPEAIA